jgi:hypothetical protein
VLGTVETLNEIGSFYGVFVLKMIVLKMEADSWDSFKCEKIVLIIEMSSFLGQSRRIQRTLPTSVQSDREAGAHSRQQQSTADNSNP